MALLFPKSTDKFVRIGAALAGAMALAGTAVLLYAAWPENLKTGYSPVQPVPYSHKLHAGELGMDCYYCHYTTFKSSYAAVPPTEVCMNCHVRVKPASPRLEKVRQSYSTNQPVRWVQIHKLADYVQFNHQAHVTVGVSCVTCHGRVDQMVEVKQVKPLNMAWCLDCHRNPAANIRPVDQVTNLAWTPDRDAAEIGREIIQAKGINPPQNCSGCHR
ncbi:MAG: cytochrome c3 family protein [Bryobacteraceae bacterium]|nr:cytochrome c3 family protein [Bryobacteraceae bacterium]